MKYALVDSPLSRLLLQSVIHALSSSSAFVACLLFGVISIHAQPVEISTSDSMEYDEAAGTLLIQGDVDIQQSPFRILADRVTIRRNHEDVLADGHVRILYDTTAPDSRFVFPELRSGADLFSESFQENASPERELLRADRVRFLPESRIILPEGPAEIQFGIARLIGDNLTIDLGNDHIEAPRYRMGFENLFISGHDFKLMGEAIEAGKTRFFFGEPEALSFQGSAESMKKEEDDLVTLRKVWLKIGKVPVFYLPYLSYNIRHTVYNVEAGAGYSGDLGYLLELRPYYSPWRSTRFFADVNSYSRRGTLIGPGLSIDINDRLGHYIRTRVESGVIRDSGEQLGVDSLNRPIDEERGFLNASHIHRYPEGMAFMAQVQAWSDSEIVRDFDTGTFRKLQQPESFASVRFPLNDWVFSAVTRFRIEDFEYATERLPELSLDLLPSPLGLAGFYHELSLSGTRLRDDNPDRSHPAEYDRFKGNYRIARPSALTPWLDWTPLVTAQFLACDNRANLPDEPTSWERKTLEAGFDLTLHAFADWKISNRIWDVQNIRHILKPTLQYRNILIDGDEDDWMPGIESPLTSTGIPYRDFFSAKALEGIREHQLVRIGLRNSVFTRSHLTDNLRTMLDLDIFHDTIIPHDSDSPTQHLLSSMTRLRPASWLSFDLETRWDSKNLDLEDLYARASLINGDFWRLDFGAFFLDGLHEQYQATLDTKLSEDARVLFSVSYNARTSQFYEQMIGFQFAIANHWDILVSISQRDGATRNNDLRWDIKIVTGRF